MNEAEAELESFRQQWREEVSARSKSKVTSSTAPRKAAGASSTRPQAPKSTLPKIPTDKPQERIEELDEVEHPTCHDVGGKESGRKLGDPVSSSAQPNEEPRSALEHYEEAVEKESQGSLGDSVNLYQKAFKVYTAYMNFLVHLNTKQVV
jgi:F-box protein 9